MHRGRDGELIPKQCRMKGENGEIKKRMSIKHFDNKDSLVRNPRKIARKTNATNEASKSSQQTAAKSPTEKVEHYDLLLSIAQARAGMNIDHFLGGDVKEAEAMAAKLFL